VIVILPYNIPCRTPFQIANKPVSCSYQHHTFSDMESTYEAPEAEEDYAQFFSQVMCFIIFNCFVNYLKAVLRSWCRSFFDHFWL
jgi:hypothetical protein